MWVRVSVTYSCRFILGRDIWGFRFTADACFDDVKTVYDCGKLLGRKLLDQDSLSFGLPFWHTKKLKQVHKQFIHPYANYIYILASLSAL